MLKRKIHNLLFLGLSVLIGITACSTTTSNTSGSITSSSTRLILTNTPVALVTTTQKVSTQTPSSLITQTSTKVASATPTPTLTPIQTIVAESTTLPEIQEDTLLLIEAYGQGYSQFDYSKSRVFSNEPSNEMLPLSVLDYHTSLESDDPDIGPGNAQLLSFANFADKMAYWVTDGTAQLWLSDLALVSPQPIYTDDHRVYNDNSEDRTKFNLFWTPDDLHLIWSIESESPQFIYHLESQIIEPWPWNCDRIALSPRTNQLAIWCVSEDSDSMFAVIEWGGDIWYSDVPSSHELVKQNELSLFSPPVWSWSSNGEKLAYFDPADPEGRLFIVNRDGSVELSFPGAGWWQTEVVAESRLFLPRILLQWSENSNKLIVFAQAMKEDACPQYQDYWSGSGDVFDVPCWHVIDMQSGRILWTWAEVVNATAEGEGSFWQVWDVAISPKGQQLALNIAVPGGVELGIVDLENELYEQWTSFGGSVIRWYGGS